MWKWFQDYFLLVQSGCDGCINGLLYASRYCWLSTILFTSASIVMFKLSHASVILTDLWHCRNYFYYCYYCLMLCRAQCPVWAWEHCRISPPRFLAECCMRRLNQGCLVLMCFALFAFSGLCLVWVLSVFLICLLSCIFQHVPTWMALYSLIVLMCR